MVYLEFMYYMYVTTLLCTTQYSNISGNVTLSTVWLEELGRWCVIETYCSVASYACR